MRRKTRLTGIVLLCAMALIVACQKTPTTPTPPVIPAEEPVRGERGPKRGEEPPTPDLPPKDEGVALPPINPEGGAKLSPDKVASVRPGTAYTEGDRDAKAPPKEEAGAPGEGPKLDHPEGSHAHHGRIQFTISREGGIVPEAFIVVPGELVPLTTIDGELFYVFTVSGEPVHAGSFRDPLYMVSLPQTRDQGYGRVELNQGMFTIAIPEALLDPEHLAASVLEFYRLGPDVPYDAPLTIRTVRAQIGASELLGEVRGSQLADMLNEQQ